VLGFHANKTGDSAGDYGGHDDCCGGALVQIGALVADHGEDMADHKGSRASAATTVAFKPRTLSTSQWKTWPKRTRRK
jgi:hypothetical protein